MKLHENRLGKDTNVHKLLYFAIPLMTCLHTTTLPKASPLQATIGRCWTQKGSSRVWSFYITSVYLGWSCFELNGLFYAVITKLRDLIVQFSKIGYSTALEYSLFFSNKIYYQIIRFWAHRSSTFFNTTPKRIELQSSAWTQNEAFFKC